MKNTALSLLTVWTLLFATAIGLAGAYAWDDGAITLAFARTLAQNGRFALTPLSEVVEGSSSLLWTGLMAALHHLLRPDFLGFIRLSQLAAWAALALTGVLLFRRLASTGLDGWQRLVLVCLLGLLPNFLAEVLNGMEMTLTAGLLLLFWLGLERRASWTYLVVPLLLLVRFEAIFYLGFALALATVWVPAAPAAPDNAAGPSFRGWLVRLGLVALLCFGLITLLRWTVFQDLLPNTVWAKMHWPYSVRGDGLRRVGGKLLGLGEFVLVTAPLLALMLLGLWQRRVRAPAMLPGATLVLSFAVFGAITGENWGYLGRMCLPCLPLLLLLAALLQGAAPAEFAPSRLAWLARWRAWAAQQGLFRVLVMGLLAMQLGNAMVWAREGLVLVKGAHFQGLLPPAVSRAVDGRLPGIRGDWSGMTPANYRVTGEAVDRLRQKLGLPSLVYMVPDVGGVGLCCEALRIVDSALLTHRTLARQGFAALPAVLAQERPDVIETHSLWTVVTDLYALPQFQRDYRPLVWDNTLLWLRQDHHARLMAQSEGRRQRLNPQDGLPGVRYAEAEQEQTELRQRHATGVWAIRSADL